MSGNNFVCDTNIILYLLGGDTSLADILEDKQIYVSFIAEIELLSFKSINESEKKQVQLFLGQCSIFDINNDIKEIAINIRKTTSLKIPDAIISATSIYLNIPIISADKKLSAVKELSLILYEK